MSADDKKLTQAKRALRVWQVFGLLMLVSATGLLLGLLIVLTRPDNTDQRRTDNDKGSILTEEICESECPYNSQFIKSNDRDNPTIFQDLSSEEINSVVNYLFNQSTLNLSIVDDAQINSSYIFSIDLEVPPKAIVLQHLDNGGPKPTRSAKAVLFRGDLIPPVVEEYLISPLPNPTLHVHVPAGTYTTYPLPFDARPMSTPEYTYMEAIISDVTLTIHDLLLQSYGAAVHNCTDKCLYFEDQTQISIEGILRQTIYIGMRDVEGPHLHPIGLEILLSHAGSDISKWKVEHVMYNNQMFSDAQDLMTQYQAGNLSILALPFPDHVDYSSFKRKGQDPSGGHQGPRMYEVEGPRYKIKGQQVEYMNWRFDFKVPAAYGLELFDIRFKEERIAYEISPQELAAYYSGHSLFMRSAQYFDVSVTLTKFEMMKGIDCPLEATYLDAYHFLDASQVSHKKAVLCIFEYKSETPIMRHYTNNYDGGYSYFASVSNYYLTIRTIMSVYNYDYILDFCFLNNGEIQVKMAATGYLLTTFNGAEKPKYGFLVHSGVIAPVHQHLYHFKVDLDIKGQRNRFVTHDISVETIPNPWYPGENTTQTFIKSNKRISEAEARILYSFDDPKKYVVYMDNSTNRYGSKRGYEIINSGMSKFLLPDVGPAKSFRWAKYQIAVSKYKELERHSSSLYACNPSLGPFVDFENFFSDDESLVDEDLVVWLSMGFQHLPVSEDVPSLSITASTTFSLRPFNYFDEDPSVNSRDAVHIVPEEMGYSVPETYGRLNDSNCIPRKHGPFKYDGSW